MATVAGPDGRLHYVYTISGVRVEFPAKAYPSQIAMMDKVIRGLQRGQHCLLESPTGSGKTLALLCASLAWQRAEAENVRKFNEAVEATARASLKTLKTEIQSTDGGPDMKMGNWNAEAVKKEPTAPKVKVESSPASDMSAYYSDDNSDDDFKMPTKKRTKISKSPPEKPLVAIRPAGSSAPIKMEDVKTERVMLSGDGSVESPVEQPFIQRKQKIPKIFFGTRTHKQITQVVKEFRRTVYCNTPMGVLASREHTCIHPEVSRSANKNEGCKILNDRRLAKQDPQQKGGCSYRWQGKDKLKTQAQIRNYGLVSGWDIEDLVSLGRRIRVCPYYASRDMSEQAQIVFSPYNYLIDPRVRQSMKIPINDNIIILDEAHNIEDSARESAGGSWSQEDFRLALNDCEKIGNRHPTMEKEIDRLAKFSSYMMQWIGKHATNMKSVGFDREVHVMTGTEFVANLSVDGYGPEMLVELKAIIDYIFNEQLESDWNDKEGSQDPQLSAATQTLLEGFLMIMDLMLNGNQIHRDDYRAVVVRTVERKQKKGPGSSFFGKANIASQWTYALNLWCLNSAVVMHEIKESTRSIIVTSGTLSPLASYQSELDIDFKLTLEANHVIPAKRVWIGTISQGPRNTLLNGTFKVTGTFEYQDELGRLALSVCQTIPHGVLCFLPSYSLLEKLVTRWQDTGLWQHLSNYKTIVCESRDSRDFEETLKSFYSAIEDSVNALSCLDLDGSGDGSECPSKKTGDVPSGALMLAVCRGKVSEGLDFTDNNARAVICVGIPFPNFKDTQVELKRQYNDKLSASTPLLNGSEWYEIQAFRALNQALGRCIRHKADWGAILLVDDRFAKTPRYVNQLSKWVRSSIRHFHCFPPMLNSLKEFADNFVAEDAAALVASQQQLLSSTQEESQSFTPMVVSSSPYFTKPAVSSPNVVYLSEDENDSILSVNDSLTAEISPLKTRPVQMNASPVKPLLTNKISPTLPVQSNEMKTTPVRHPVSRIKKPFATLLGNSNKLSLSQRKLAAENGSHYFQDMNPASANVKPDFDS
ncbi:Fanconi anemia group J protein homolog [Daphnia pulicaria]|uniref:Fanconi anemia group J protein homolog n=1 Tax=Daphnia pulicaria TaxID=35523 RepID=UPI001EEAB4B6|nr:Fanconi anemia group J protein homolog [Daphnia pulicaria]XP_046655150.1 Fanconi anemia group J protein homolog [Daphnia pulicaria]